MTRPNKRRLAKNKSKSIQSIKQSALRIVGGTMRGRKVSFAAAEGLRPTLDQVRETLFNWLMPDISGAKCLDLFAGSGALAFEAVSRGAQSVALVESNKHVVINLQNNIALLKITNAKVVANSAEEFLSSNTEIFDIVFIDPPFEKGLLNLTLKKIKVFLAEDAKVYIEHERSQKIEPAGEEWQVLKSKQTSRFCYSLLSLK